MSNRNILVTGGAGYIGSKIVADLLKKKFRVFVIDNFSTGFKFLVPKKAEIANIDLLNIKKVENFFKKRKINSIIHLAASLNVEESQKNPLKYYKNNVLGIENLLKVATQYNLKNFVLSSTCAVYGVNKSGHVNEKSPKLPESNYGKTKMLSEEILKNFSKKFKFNYGILRYFNVIGADRKLLTGPVKSTSLFKILAENIVKKKFQISIFGKNYNTKDGTCIRDFIDVNDLSDLHLLTLNQIKKKKSLIINCGYGIPLTVKEVVNKFSEGINKKIKIKYKDRRPGDLEKIYCDTSNLKKVFKKWKRKVKLTESIKNQILWEQKLKKNAKY